MNYNDWKRYYNVDILIDPNTAPDEQFQIVSTLDDTILYCCDPNGLRGDSLDEKVAHLIALAKSKAINLKNYIGPACWYDFASIVEQPAR